MTKKIIKKIKEKIIKDKTESKSEDKKKEFVKKSMLLSEVTCHCGGTRLSKKNNPEMTYFFYKCLSCGSHIEISE